MLTPVAPPGCPVPVRSTSHLLFGMLIPPRMPLLVLLLICSFNLLQIFCLEVAFCVLLCEIKFAHIFELSFRTAFFKKGIFEKILTFPVINSGGHAAAAIYIWCLRALRSQ